MTFCLWSLSCNTSKQLVVHAVKPYVKACNYAQDNQFSVWIPSIAHCFTGLLESPVMPPHAAVDTVHYKIFMSGKSGVGKTALASRLAGLNIPNLRYETTGRPNTLDQRLIRSRKYLPIYILLLKVLRQQWCIGQRSWERLVRCFSSACSCGTVERMPYADLTICSQYVSNLKYLHAETEKLSYSHLIRGQRHTRRFVTSLSLLSSSPVRSRWTQFFSCSPLLTGHPLKIFLIRLPSGMGRLWVVL